MICHNLADTLGFQCSPLNDDGSIAHIATPFRFADGNPVPVYMQINENTVRFFDDGDIFMHFRGRGFTLDNRSKARFIINAAQNNGATFTEDWTLETLCPVQQAPEGFASYIQAISSICAWERENEGIDEESDTLIESIVMAMRAANPSMQVAYHPSYKGISGKQRQLSFSANGVGISVTTTHPSAVNAALHAMMDIKQCTESEGLDFMFIIEDSRDQEKAQQEATILQAVAPVRLSSSLMQAQAQTH